MNSRVYLDHNATTPLDPAVKAALPGFADLWGNPSSIHQEGRGPKNLIRETRSTLASVFKVSPLEIIFNSGATEGNNTVLKSVFEARGKTRPQIITSSVEHPSVARTLDYLKGLGAQIDVVPVNRQGQIDINVFKSLLSERTALVSIMYANNEIGSIFPIREMCEAAHAVGALFHSDCVQTLGKVNLDLANLGVDYATFSAHKFYAPKGCGFLYVKKGSPYSSLVLGGAQERHRRAGTENTLGIFSLGVMAQQLSLTPEKAQHMRALRDFFESEIMKTEGVQITAVESERIANTSSLVIDGIDGETLLMSLDMKGFAVSTGAACSSGSPEPSPVLLAIGLSRAEAQKSLRVSFGWHNTPTQVEKFLTVLKETIEHLRKIELQMKKQEIV